MRLETLIIMPLKIITPDKRCLETLIIVRKSFIISSLESLDNIVFKSFVDSSFKLFDNCSLILSRLMYSLCRSVIIITCTCIITVL